MIDRSPSRSIPVLTAAMKKAPAAFAEVFLAMSRELPLDCRAKQHADALLTLVDSAFWGGGLGEVEVDPVEWLPKSTNPLKKPGDRDA